MDVLVKFSSLFSNSNMNIIQQEPYEHSTKTDKFLISGEGLKAREQINRKFKKVVSSPAPYLKEYDNSESRILPCLRGYLKGYEQLPLHSSA